MAEFEKDEKTGMLKPVWSKPRRSRGIADVANAKSSDEIAGSQRPTALAQRGIAFEDPKGWWWAGLDKEVRFTVKKDGCSYLCRLPAEWLKARYNCESTDKALLAAARADFDPLTDMAEAALNDGKFKDGFYVFGT
jgi:hypothetical protein